MLTIAYYFLQVVLCSALMMGYYWLVLRNKRFHQYNRFYLLAIAVLSWIVPLIKIKWGQPAANDLQVMQLLSVVADNNTQIEETLSSKGFAWNIDMAVTALYIIISAALLFAMMVAFIRIYRLLQQHSCKNVGEVFLIITQAKGTPFSFFRYIFWNEEIDIRSEAGKQILQHELTHVKQKHSIDKIFIQLMLVAGWFNPFFWLLKKEMEMIHEFIADKKAVNNGDTASLAQMLLTAAYPSQHFALTHPFFFSPIKRRLQMLTNNTNPRFSYIRRLVVLPLLAVVVVLFAFRNKDSNTEITLSVANVVEQVADANVVTKIAESVKDRINKYAENEQIQNPDTLILKADTITVNNGSKLVVINKGGEVKVIKNEVSKISAEIALSANTPLIIMDGKKIDNNVLSVIDPNKIATIDVLKNESATALYGEEGKNGVILVRTKAVDFMGFGAKVTVIPHSNNERVEVAIPSVDSAQSLSFSSSNKLRINNGNGPQPIWIVDGEPAEITAMENMDPKNIQSVSVLKGEKAIKKYGDKAVNGVVEITTKQKQFATKLDNVVVIDYNESDPTGIKALKNRNPDVKHAYLMKSPLTLTVELKNGSKEVYNLLANSDRKKAENKYGKLPVLPSASSLSMKTISDKATAVFSQPQIPAEFPGGTPAWSKYLMRNLDKEIVRKHGGPPGKYTVVVSFTIDEYGSLSNIKALNDPGYGAKEEAIRMIAKGPKWKPAQQNGKPVRSVHEQSISFLVLEEEKKTLR